MKFFGLGELDLDTSFDSGRITDWLSEELLEGPIRVIAIARFQLILSLLKISTASATMHGQRQMVIRPV